MKAFVEFETSYTKSFPCRIQNLIKNGTSRGMFSFYWPILLYRKSRENVQQMLFRGSSYKMPKVKKLSFVLSTYSDNSYRHFTPGVRGKVLLFKLI